MTPSDSPYQAVQANNLTRLGLAQALAFPVHVVAYRAIRAMLDVNQLADVLLVEHRILLN